MGIFTTVELEQIKREVTNKVEQEFELFLTKFEESFKKRKEDLVETICKDVVEAMCKDITTKFNNQIDTLHKEIKVEMSKIEQGIYLDIDRIVNNIE